MDPPYRLEHADDVVTLASRVFAIEHRGADAVQRRERVVMELLIRACGRGLDGHELRGGVLEPVEWFAPQTATSGRPKPIGCICLSPRVGEDGHSQIFPTVRL